MSQLKIAAVPDDKPVKVSAELPANVHRDLLVYADLLAARTGQAVDPLRLIAPMLALFMATDRGFSKARRQAQRPASDG
jgi:hypothetical protein